MGKIVGILSMQKVLNYGSYLQAYGLKQLLLKNGAEQVYFIDIKQGKSIPGYEPPMKNGKSLVYNSLNYLRKQTLLSEIKDYFFIKRVVRSIAKKHPYLGIGQSLPDKFDLVVIGSDEVFNCCQATQWGYTRQLYGDISNADEVISYAGSFGSTTYEQLSGNDIAEEIGNTMKLMSDISVRDDNSKKIVEKITGITPMLHVDPVLAYGYADEINQRCTKASRHVYGRAKANFPDNYLLVYSYHKRIQDNNEIKNIVDFAKSRRLKILSVFCRYDWCDKAIIPSDPFEVLAWFKRARFVITDTFHGTVFSIITQSNFCTIIRNTNSQKLTSLLEHFHLSDRSSLSCDFNTVFNAAIDYNEVNAILKKDREQTDMYLKKHL